MSELIASISGIRGITGETLLPETVLRYVPAFARFCGGGPIVLGYDGRPSGAPLMDIAAAVLQLEGIDVIRLGMVPTPTVQLKVEHSDARGGIAITASHNPSQWNGLKFLNSGGVFLDAEENARMFAMADEQPRPLTVPERYGSSSFDEDVSDWHIDRVLSSLKVDTEAIAARSFTIAVDAVNASGSVIIPRMLERLGCTVIPVACDGSGVFPHTPEPLPENLVSLGEAVRESGADMGFAIDPDADRLVLFTEEGVPFGEEYTITTAVHALCSAAVADGNSAQLRVAVNLSTTRAVDDVAAGFGAEVFRSPVGEINVVRKMRDVGAIIGGEGSGGVIVPAVHAGRDSLVGIALVLSALSRFDGPASAFRASLPSWHIRKFRYPAEGKNIRELLQRAAETFAAERINTDDGVRIDFEDGWVHLRGSNTEPIVRVIAEARTGDEADAFARRVADTVFDDGQTP